MHSTTGASPNKLMFGRELRGKLPEALRHTEYPDDAMVRKRDREQKEKDIQLRRGLKWAKQFYTSKKRRTA